ncbi:MAG: hypothetical protein HLUCCO17_12555 [Saliniramus fredricksonii]|uniref:Uncharacterized protein n=1 Tax=Saliniramus fredricksonii TaxID=1653334 RepID=A0A0P8BKL8_9HYPH|nr:MAG: hypothetical protein HLUCCO17_12555 [Saliniramus fredricksonii]
MAAISDTKTARVAEVISVCPGVIHASVTVPAAKGGWHEPLYRQQPFFKP